MKFFFCECVFTYSNVFSSGSISPVFPPISIAMLESTIRSSMLMSVIVWPVNSQLLYVDPSTPTVPMMCRITSLEDTFSFSCPSTLNWLVSGTLNHSCPVENTIAMSVDPIPVANVPNAPYAPDTQLLIYYQTVP